MCLMKERKGMEKGRRDYVVGGVCRGERKGKWGKEERKGREEEIERSKEKI